MIPIEFLNLIIKRSSLDKIYPGGSSAFITNHEPFDGQVNAYDEDFVKFGAMGPGDIHAIAEDMESLGLIGVTDRSGEQFWIDYCVIDELFGPTLHCDWIKYDRKFKTVELIEK
jgi:hypothetical protein